MEFIGGIISFLCFLYVIVSVWKTSAPKETKWVWTLLAIIPGFNIVTAIAYIFLGPNSARA